MIATPHVIAVGIIILDLGGLVATGIVIFYVFAFAVIRVRETVSARFAKPASAVKPSSRKRCHNMYGITISSQNPSRVSLNTRLLRGHKIEFVRPEHTAAGNTA